jgi:hypothetical protein
LITATHLSDVHVAIAPISGTAAAAFAADLDELLLSCCCILNLAHLAALARFAERLRLNRDCLPAFAEAEAIAEYKFT